MSLKRPVGVNKDGYASGGVKVEESSQNLHLDPRSQTSIRGLINMNRYWR